MSAIKALLEDRGKAFSRWLHVAMLHSEDGAHEDALRLMYEAGRIDAMHEAADCLRTFADETEIAGWLDDAADDKEKRL